MLRVEREFGTSLLLGMALAVLLAQPLHAADEGAPAPRILVAPVVGVAREQALDSHPRLVKALRARFGERVVDHADVVEAQKRTRVWPNQLLMPDGVARLAAAVGAERAIILSASKRGLTVLVYSNLGQKATRSIPIRGIKADRIEDKDAERIASLIDQKARVLLQHADPPLVAIDVGVAEVSPASSQPWQERTARGDSRAAVVSPSDEILEEEQREADALASLQRARKRVPALFLATGFSVGSRQVDLGGSQLRRVIPIESGALPGWSVSASVLPLRLIPALNRSPLADLVLDASYRRGLYSGSYEGGEVRIDDDDLTLRGSYRRMLFHHAYAPWLGLGGGWGWQRSEIGCCLPAPSTRYLFAEVHARAVQPLWPPLLTVEGVLAARQPVGQGGGIMLRPAWQGEAWLVLHAAPLFFARAGLRTASFGGWQSSRFSLDERLTTLGFEVGGYY
ncbi:MAG: hypothetical protein ABIJ09_15515 [Pseudomonadota bacterium]